MRYFVDSNVLVYARDSTETAKQRQAHRWLEHLWRTREGRLSFQVLHEYYVTVTAKLVPGLSLEDARDDVRALYAWQPLAIDDVVVAGAWRVQDRHGFSWWDSLIVAAAQVLDCDYLLTEDLQHNQSIDGVTIVDPFAPDAALPFS
ncbi:MAG: PIN domain-containing protein [Alphaproteobacteria bacterium]|nr:PIN domain-containing protein [Alphaproteobacteria bacterium]